MWRQFGPDVIRQVETPDGLYGRDGHSPSARAAVGSGVRRRQRSITLACDALQVTTVADPKRAMAILDEP